MEIFMDSVKVIGRIITILPFMLFVTLYMGKRSIGELPVFDFLVILVLGAVVGADIADPKINHFHTIVAMIVIALLHKLIIYLKMKNRNRGKLMTFEPAVVIYKGQFLCEKMKKEKYSIDNILQMLREKNVYNVGDVEIAIIEANGNLSVKMIPSKEVVIREDLKLTGEPVKYEIPIILDGKVQFDLLRWLKKSEVWLEEKLAEQNISDIGSVFYGSYNRNGELFLSMKEVDAKDVPPIEH
ncbi:DUF421 domain-containing protein [Pseudalkalibacillus salsuginis]|uniref:DUF421 domain-containing protein n=1 Tax=Pseudalkalibacillus salsuginis TaxID=2910972 RepID=UPI001F1A1395|nr:DUF421 domain-containing protein [Pseudalkalibacillus salsuginis]MCF6409272.1 DUF421 domain-containing protein [Pseudalkalibacillus salsuginis]